MRAPAVQFKQDARRLTADLRHRQTIQTAMGKYEIVRDQRKAAFQDWQGARQMAAETKWQAVNHLDRHLEQFVQKLEAGKVRGSDDESLFDDNEPRDPDAGAGDVRRLQRVPRRGDRDDRPEHGARLGLPDLPRPGRQRDDQVQRRGHVPAAGTVRERRRHLV